MSEGPERCLKSIETVMCGVLPPRKILALKSFEMVAILGLQFLTVKD